MEKAEGKIKPTDVICQISKDGSIIPIKFQITNEDGEVQTYKIKSYRPVPKKGAYTTKDGAFVCNQTEIFECLIDSFGRSIKVRLYYEPKRDGIWYIGTT